MNPVDELGDAVFAAASCFVVVYGAYMLARGLQRREAAEPQFPYDTVQSARFEVDSNLPEPSDAGA